VSQTEKETPKLNTKRLRGVEVQFEDYAPGLARVLPDGVLSAINAVFYGWQKLGILRYIFAGIMLAAIALPLGPAKDEVLVRTGFYMLAALGLNVVVGLAGLLDLGYVAFFMIGSYTVALFTESNATAHPAILDPWLILPIAVVVAMVTGLLLGTPTLRLRGDYLAIVTLGFHEIVRQTARNLSVVNGSRGVTSIPHPDFSIFGKSVEFGVLDPQKYWFVLCVFIVIALFIVQRIKDSRIGRSWEAIREDEVAASAMGIPVVKMKLYAFAIGASTSGLAGWALATKVGFISPNNFPLLSSILVLCAVVIGGIGSSLGALLGAALVFGLPELLRDIGAETILGFDVQTGRIAIFGFLLVVMMIFRPGGLISSSRRRAELSSGGDIAADSTAPGIPGES
jgi:branched-chain amino acid transport system permease protein